MANKFIMSVSPHVHSGNSTREIMREVLIALTPAGVLGIIFFGWRALLLIVVSVATSVLAEMFCSGFSKKGSSVDDLSAAVTGLLLAYSVSPALPWWAASLGALFAVVVAKIFFGGLGFNIFNPALAGRAFLMASFPVFMTTWPRPFDGVTGATPLGIIKEHLPLQLPQLSNLFLGNIGGCLGETSALALLVGALYLFYKKIIDWRIPTAYLGSVVILAYVFHQPVLVQLLAGGLMLGAFFMATDYTTSPMSAKAKLIFGVGCGILTMVIRQFGGYPEGVCYAILIMNMFVPLLDKVR